MEQFPQIETERLLLSRLQAVDIPAIVQYAANQKISRFTGNLPFPYTEKDAVYWLNQANQGFKNKTQIILGIRLRPEPVFTGGIALTIDPGHNRAEIGYWLAEPFWNNGYTTEAARAIIRFGFDQLGLQKLTSSHLALNPASGRVLLKSGMRKEGELQEHILKNSVYHTLVLYGLTRNDYESNNRS
jgi:RimJ/RimL family protein N-acetyltransferase